MGKKSDLSTVRIVFFMILVMGINSCMITPPKISIPLELSTAPRMQLSGGINANRFEFGPFYIHDIREQVISIPIYYTEELYSPYPFGFSEFRLVDQLGNSFDCDCEYPQRDFWTDQLRCVFQDTRNPYNRWELRENNLSQRGLSFQVMLYAPHGQSRGFMAPVLSVYAFSQGEGIKGLVDISGIPGNESVWIQPTLEPDIRMVLAAVSAGIILKNRRVYYQEGEDDMQDFP